MNSSSATHFCKQLTCPSSGMLLSYHEADLTTELRAWIAAHLAVCDFCGAEFRLLVEHSPIEEECVLMDMPLHLRRLAESLLARCCFDLETFAETAYDKEPLTLTDA